MTKTWLKRLECREEMCREDRHDKEHHGVKFRLLALVYTVFFFIKPYYAHSAHVWMVFAAVYIPYVALFLLIPLTRGVLRTVLLVVFSLMGFFYVPYDPTASGMFVYPMSLLPYLLRSSARSVLILIVYVAAIVTEGLWLNLSPWSFLLGAFFTVVVHITNVLVVVRIESTMKLNLAGEEIERLAKTAERERIARDLHDLLGHTLTVVVLKAQVVEQLIPSQPDMAVKEALEIQATARQALADVREAVLGFRSKGLQLELVHAKETLQAAGIECDVRMLPEDLPMLVSREQEMVLTLSVREAVTNIVRHSAARYCSVHLTIDVDHVQIHVEDDGKGGTTEGGFGLRGMRERVETLGGSLWVNGAHGMKITLKLPMGGKEQLG